MSILEQIATDVLPTGMGWNWSAMSYQEAIVGNQIYFVFALAVIAYLGQSLFYLTCTLGVLGIPAFMRVARAATLTLGEREFVVAARALGGGEARLVLRHVFPNALPPLMVQATTSFPVAILAEAALAYLGLGTQPPHPSWGLMLREAQNFLSFNPWFAVFPGGAIAVTVLGLNLLGDGLRDLLDPRTV